jgi:hypothetical protein
MSMVRVVYTVTMEYFFGRGGVRHLGNLAVGRSSGWWMIGLHVERRRKLMALDKDTQEQVLEVLRQPCLSRTEHALGARHRGSSSEGPINGREQCRRRKIL